VRAPLTRTVASVERRWSIGELARAAGLTVRTLYHYDDIGLVRASERTAAGHRRYTPADVRRLYRVRALRGLGLSLEDVAVALSRTADDDLTTLRSLLTAQLASLSAHAERISGLRRQIGELLSQLESPAPPDMFMKALELTAMADSYFTQEQRASLVRRTEELGREKVEALRAEALALLTEIGRHQQAGTPVDDPRVRALTERVDELGTSIHDADPKIIAAANRMWQDNGAEIGRSLGLPTPTEGPDLVEYLQEARRARLAGPSTPDSPTPHEGDPAEPT
jgi:MerR family transcriptional regulator, thiopeptide resistance regulator